MNKSTNIIYLHKKVFIDDAVLYNVLVDGLLSYGYGTLKARKMADEVLSGKPVNNGALGVKVTKRKLIDAVRRTMLQYEYEVEYISDSGREVLSAIL